MKAYRRKKRTFFSGPVKNKRVSKAIRQAGFGLYLLTVLPLIACYLSQWISPASAWPFAFFGLLFPLLIAFQFLFIPIFFIFKSKAVGIPIILIIIGWNAIQNTFQVPRPWHSGTDEGKTIQVMTYNVRLFDILHWSGQENQSAGIFAYVSKIKPDILCFQEFALQDPGRFSLDYIKNQLPDLPNSVIEYNYTNQNRKHGLAIFSRYPIVNSGHEHFEDTRNMMLYADVAIGKDTIRVYNNHLESIHLDRDEFQWIDTTTNKTRIPRDKLTGITHRLRGAYKKRAGQADLVRKNIDHSPYRVIVCGDFNDTPVSYATHRIGGDLYDSFRSGGHWLGITFPNVKAPLRIDYILHDKEMESSHYQIGKIRFSDHRPVSCRISLQ